MLGYGRVWSFSGPVGVCGIMNDILYGYKRLLIIIGTYLFEIDKIRYNILVTMLHNIENILVEI